MEILEAQKTETKSSVAMLCWLLLFCTLS